MWVIDTAAGAAGDLLFTVWLAGAAVTYVPAIGWAAYSRARDQVRVGPDIEPDEDAETAATRRSDTHSMNAALVIFGPAVWPLLLLAAAVTGVWCGLVALLRPTVRRRYLASPAALRDRCMATALAAEQSHAELRPTDPDAALYAEMAATLRAAAADINARMAGR